MSELDTLDVEQDEVIDTAEGSVPEVDAPEAEAVPLEPTDGDSDAPADPAPVAAEAAPPEVVEPPVPFGVNVFGQPYQIPGVTFDAKARTLAVQDDKSFARVQQLLTKGREYETRGRQEIAELRRQVEQTAQVQTAEQQQAATFLAELMKLKDGTEQDIYDFALAFKQNAPMLMAQAERDFLKQQLQQTQAPQGPAVDVDTVIEQARAGIAELVEDHLQNQPWATPSAKAELTELLSDVDTMDRFVKQAGRDIPERGVRAGQWLSDWDTARSILDRLAKPYQSAHQQMAQAASRVTATSTVATNNAKALAAATAQRPRNKAGEFVAQKAAPQTPAPSGMDALSKKLDRDWENILAGNG